LMSNFDFKCFKTKPICVTKCKDLQCYNQ